MPTWKKAFPKHKAFHCNAYWHFVNSGLWLAIYNLIGAVTDSGERPFVSSKKTVARYFNKDYETVRRVFRKMEKAGWLERRGDGELYYVDHATWAERHPDQCYKRAVLVWENETDPFVGKLWAVAGGKLHLYPGHVVAARRVANDEEFIEAFQKEFMAAQERKAAGQYDGTGAKACFFRVLKVFRQRAMTAVETPG